MRETGGEKYFKSIFASFESRMNEHIENYGSDNHLRLTGKHETQSIDKFSWGVSDRGASIRVPKVVGETWKGYLEDRRPASNANPYSILNVICESLKLAEQLFETSQMMFDVINVTDLNEKYGAMSNDELLSEYMTDEMEITNNILYSNGN